MSNRQNNNFFQFTSLIATLFLSVFMISSVYASTQSQNSQSKVDLPFIKNQGQKISEVAYYANALGGTVFVTQQGELVYSLPKKSK